MYDIVVLGGGPAGVTAALRASELGTSVALVERGRMGGTCTNDGCVPTRALAKAARLRRDAAQFEDYGLSGVQIEVDFERLIARTQYIVYQIHEKKQLIKHLEDSGVDVYAEVGPASFLDEHTVSFGQDGQLEGKKFILCVGGHARRFPFPGVDLALTHSDIWSLKKLPESVAIVGAAATGCQLASIFNAFGVQVYLLDLAPDILPLEDRLTSQVMSLAFQLRGIENLTGIGGVQKIEKNTDGRLMVQYQVADDTQTLEVETVVLAVGWVGNLEDLNLGAAGVETKRGYVVVDDYLRTTAENIYAAGDITGRMMLVQSGSYEGRVAAENAVLGPGNPQQHLVVPHGGFTDPEYGSVGLTEQQATTEGLDYTVAVVPYADIDRGVIDGYTEGFCKLIVSKDNHRIIGAHVVGEQALEVIQLVAAGMAADMWVEQLAEIELAYPTYTAIVGLAARQIVRELGVMPLAPQWRALARAHAAEWERRDTNSGSPGSSRI